MAEGHKMQLIQINFENGDILLTEGFILEVVGNALFYKKHRSGHICYAPKVRKVFVS